MTAADFKAIRKALNLTQQQLGEEHLWGMSSRQVRRIEKGTAEIKDHLAERMNHIDPRGE